MAERTTRKSAARPGAAIPHSRDHPLDFAGALVGAGVTPEEYQALGPDGMEVLVAAVPDDLDAIELRSGGPRIRTR